MFRRRCAEAETHLPKQDRQTIRNVYHVSEFCPKIMKNMYTNEKKWQVDSNYMMDQKKICERIRSQLIDWIIRTHFNFKLLPESLFLTVNIIDRYLSKVLVVKEEVQVIGVAAMLIATKYEEIYPPQLKDFVYITDNQCDANSILEMEMNILI